MKAKKERKLLDTRAAELYLAAAEMPLSERTAFLQQQVENDPDLFERVQALLAEHQAIDGFLESPLVGPLSLVPPENPPLPNGTELGDFQIVRLLGEGGLARVYLAHQKSLGRQVALKVSEDAGGEGQILANLEHDHIVKVFSEISDRQKNLKITCMQYVAGVSLDDVIETLAKFPGKIVDGPSLLSFLKSRPETADEKAEPAKNNPLKDYDLQEAILWIGIRLAQALAYSHSKGIFHLDVKPNNILLNADGRPFLMDFNVSINSKALLSGEAQQLGGTFQYSSPEHQAVLTSDNPQEEAAKIDHRADIYSLGLVLGTLLRYAAGAKARTFRPNHTTLLKDAKLRAAENFAPLPAKIDAGIRAIIQKCVATNPKERFQSTESLVTALGTCLELRTITKSLPSPGLIGFFAIRRHYFFLSLVLSFPIGVAGVVNGWYQLKFISPDYHPLFLQTLMLASGVFLLSLLGLWRALVHLNEDASTTYGVKRAAIVNLPARFLGWVTLLWIPTSLLGPLVLLAMGEPVALELWGQWMALSALLGLTATGHSLLICGLVGLRVFYPRFWRSAESIRQTAQKELSGVGTTLRFTFLLAVIPPNLGIVLLVLNPTVVLSEILPTLGALALLGLFGAVLSIRASHRLSAILFPFLGR